MIKKFLPLIFLFLLLCPLLFWGQLSSGKVRIWQFDVGQGDGALVETAEKQYILIDGGPDRKILDKLESALPFGQKKIDIVVISHPHADHIDGLTEVFNEYEIDFLIYSGVFSENQRYQKLLLLAAKKGVKLILIDGSFDLKIGNLIIDIIYPDRNIMGTKFNNVNNSSIVMRLIFGKNIFWFGGDMEDEIEIIKNKNLDLSAQIMKAGHHGSRTSNSIEMIKRINPQYFVISCGIKNKFNHPAPETLKNAWAIGAKIWRTDLTGDFLIQSDGEKLFF